MSLFNETLPQWDSTGTDPGATKKTNGWAASEKPPAGWFNWLFNRIYACIVELRTVTTTVNTKQNSVIRKIRMKGMV